MASTNPFQPVDNDAIDGINESIADVGIRGRRARRNAAERTKSKRSIKQRKDAARAAMDYGFPAWEGLRPVLLFLLFPAMMAIGVALTGPWPIWMLYGSAALMGLYVFFSAFKTVELVLACFLLYVPFSTTYVIPVAPGVNGTNMLILLGLFASVLAKAGGRLSWLNWPPGTTTVFIFGFISAISGFTIMRETGGYEYLLYGELLSYKAWLDQFVMYFIALSCIRNIETAKRVVIYMCIGTVILTLYAIPEMLDKMGGSTIDKSRIGGPHQQPNMFGGFLAYSMLPLVAIFVTYIKDIRAWLLTPYFLLAVKVLITTFSRGAYVAMALGGFMAAYFKGKGFLIFFGTLGLCLLLVFPSLIPNAVVDRLFPGDETVQSSEPEKLDKSSEHRIIMWRIGGEMILESPILGKGFKGFQKLKSEYIDTDIYESDPHNTYIYIASQMGIPAMVLFLLILGFSFHLGRSLSRNKDDLFIRAIGVGGASATVCYAVICIFGSRAVNLEFTSNFWAYLVCMQVIDMQLRQKLADAKPKKRRTNAYEARSEMEANPSQSTAKPDQTIIVAEEEAQRRLLPSPAGQRHRKRSNTSLAKAREKRRRLKHHRS